MTEQRHERFSLVIGGPFYRLQQRLGLLGPDLLPPVRTALLFAAIAWLPPALLSVMRGYAWDTALDSRAYFFDFVAYARYLVAIVVFVSMERSADARIASLTAQFPAAGLVPADERGRLMEVLRLADRRSGSALAEALLLCAAYAVSATGACISIAVVKDSWMGIYHDGHPQFSPAGWWVLLFSLPLFWFLLLRWLWRFVVWARLLRDVAKLKLRLVATHPDLSGGVGFLSLYPLTFVGLVFALSCVVASVALKAVLFGGATLNSMAMQFTAWLAFVLIVFVGPLAVFVPTLSRLKHEALLEYGALASRHNLAFEAAKLRGEDVVEDPLGAADVSSLADLAAVMEVVRRMRTIPAGLDAVIPLAIATGLPWLVVAATQVPLVDILKAVAGALL